MRAVPVGCLNRIFPLATAIAARNNPVRKQFAAVTAALTAALLAMPVAHAQPVTVTGAAQTFDAGQCGKTILRSGGGAAVMLDTLPGSDLGVLPSGCVIVVKNQDASALWRGANDPACAGRGSCVAVDGSSTGYAALGPGQSVRLESTGAAYYSVFTPERVKFGFLSAPTIYVAPGGNDSNSGLASTEPFQTIQAGMDALFTRYDHGGSKFTMQLAPGTYAGFSVRGGFTGHYGNPQIAVPPTFMLRGDPNDAASYVIDGGQQAAIETVLGKSLHADGVTLQSAGSVCVGSAMTGSEIVLQTIRFNSCAGGAVFAYGGAMIWQGGPWDVSGDSRWLVYVNQGSTYSSMNLGGAPTTITFNGARTFSNFVFGSARGASIQLARVSLSGASVTGQKWATACGGTIDANGAVLNTIIPGTVNGGDRTATLCPP